MDSSLCLTHLSARTAPLSVSMDLSPHIHPTCHDAMFNLNAIRNGDRKQLADALLSGADLRRADLREADLRDATLRDADLRRALFVIL